jgi:hypothetical protein
MLTRFELPLPLFFLGCVASGPPAVPISAIPAITRDYGDYGDFGDPSFTASPKPSLPADYVLPNHPRQRVITNVTL